ncbi:type VI secretion protein IcmF/TssM N-terminal domain-containing protein [Succinivibrio dextrinosolvens]|uniref:ImcF-related N-terminal domain-containing protein n=1 Tax=Succinivibrio dextrinosolvens TaxID=83771 RepID=A0A662ZAH0_9GAMM|nr:type VI secretion protein IcmF/TssM N-terminal domain-containing protein [Succinivibrio dextrinosolvens]SFK09459.1 ImcF-related N-terminal domain-containing protein [Succinivibrio dextrinosolvens]
MNEKEVTSQGADVGFIMAHPIWTVVIILGIIIFIFLMIRFVFFLNRKRQKTVEVASLKKDLMIWSRLSSFVRGGKETDKAKLELNNKLVTIDSLFKDCSTILKVNRKLYRHNLTWHLIVGEPNCGKSVLLEKSGLDYNPSFNEGKDKPPVKFYINSKEVVVDVSGKVFFDNWAGGSSAEWNYICSKIRKANRRKPLESIVVTISAESLIADNKELTLKKAHLIVNELLHLAFVLRMNLPCYVVITKLDTVLGFREYFSVANDSITNQIVGYQPKVEDGFFHSDDFNISFDKLVQRLKAGAVNQLMRPDVVDLTNKNESRMPLTGNIYLFADGVSELKDNLSLYLETIFGSNSLRGRAILPFKGVFLTSAEDKGYCLSNRFAQLQNSTVDDAPIVDNNKLSSAFFIKKLLSLKVFGEKKDAIFTKRELFIRNLPFYSCCGGLILISLIYWYGTLFKAGEFEKKLEDGTFYYQKLAKDIESGAVDSAQLFSVNDNGKVIRNFDIPMPNSNSISRLNFFSQAQKRLIRPVDAPWQFFPQSMVHFDWSNDSIYGDNYFIYDYIQTKMAFFPVVDIVEYNMIKYGHEPYDEHKTDALFNLMDISFFNLYHKNVYRNDAYSSSIMKSFIKWILPSFTEVQSSQFEYFIPEYDYSNNTTNSAIVLDENYSIACKAGIEGLVSNWRNLGNYSRHNFIQLNSYINAANDMLNSYEELEEIANQDYKEMEYEHVKSMVYRARAAASMYLTKSPVIDELMKYATVDTSSSIKSTLIEQTEKVIGEKGKTDAKSEVNPFSSRLSSAYSSYKSLLDRDFGQLKNFEKKLHILDDNAGGQTVHFGGVDFSSFDTVKHQALTLIDYKNEEMKKSLIKINQSQLFTRDKKTKTQKKNDTDKSSENDINQYNYNLLRQIIQLSKLSVVSGKMEQWTLDELDKNTTILDSEYERNIENLTSILDDHQGNELVNHWITNAKRLLAADYSLQYVDIIKQLQNLYPYDESEYKILSNLSVIIAKDEVNRSEELNIKYQSAREVLGDFKIRDEYNPQVFFRYFEPLVFIKKAMESKSKEFVFAKRVLASSSRLKKILNAFATYSSSYMKYWYHLPDTVHMTANSYAEFYDISSDLKAYMVNNELQRLYTDSYEIISKIDPIMLNKSDVELRNNFLTQLDSRRKFIDLDFIDICNETLTEWSLLSGDATYANNLVMQMSQKEINEKLLNLSKPPKGNAYIPWWSDFTKLGVKLLKRDASHEASLSLMQFQSELKVFPIVKDADPQERILSKNDIKSLLVIFKSFGLSDTSSEKASDPLAAFAKQNDVLKKNDDLKSPLIFSPETNRQADFKSWASSISNILGILSGSGKNMQFKIGLVDASDQSRLLTAQNINSELAIARYRYFDITVGDGKTTQKLPAFVNGNKNIAISSAPIDNSEIVFRFYRFSDSADPDCQVVIDGGYPALQLYLDERGEYNEDTKSTFVPIEIVPDEGDPSVFFVSLGIVGKLPTPEEWPGSDNWPAADSFANY